MKNTQATERLFAVVPAAGVGSRMGAKLPKQYLPLLSATVMEYTLQQLLAEPRLHLIVVVVAAIDQRWQSLAVMEDPRIQVVVGGSERCHSVLNGLESLSQVAELNDWVLVHDVARPCLAARDLNALIETFVGKTYVGKTFAGKTVGGILAVPASDTIKQVGGDGVITATVDRSHLWQAQTPQMFRYPILKDALTEGIDKGCSLTDEASAIELAGFTAIVVEGSSSNIKITRPEDLALAEFYLDKAEA